MKGFTGRLLNTMIALALLAFAALPSAALASETTPAAPGSTADSAVGKQPVDKPLEIARAYIDEKKSELGLSQADLSELLVTDLYSSSASGLTHVYLRQQYMGLDVSGANLNMNILPDGRVLSMNSSLLPNLAGLVNTTRPSLSAANAVQTAAETLGLGKAETLEALTIARGPEQAVIFNDGGISLSPIPARLVYAPAVPATEAEIDSPISELRLAWDIYIYQLDAQHAWSMRVDAVTGDMLEQDDYVDHESYTVYPAPVETPNHTTPVPPTDGRVTVNNPYNATASPFGWHDTNGVAGAEFTTTQGNNVNAYSDIDANNVPDVGSSPSGGTSLNFNFAIDFTQPPSAYRPAAISNLFY